MSQSVTEAQVKQFNANLFHLSQQQGSRYSPAVRNESQRGKSQFFDRLGPVTAQEKTSRHSDTPLFDTPHSRRRVTLSTFEHGDLVDEADKVRMLMDPSSEYLKAFVWAFGRAKDDKIIIAADGTSYSGEEGSTPVAHPNSQKIVSIDGAGAAANLNVDAMRRAKAAYDSNDVDPSIKRYCGINSSGLQSMLAELEVTSADFNSVRALVNGEMNDFLNFEYIRSERTKLQSGALSADFTAGTVGSGGGDVDGFRKTITWAMNGLLLATGRDVTTEIAKRADKSFSTQVFASMDIGATRLEEEKVVVIFTDES